MGITVTSNKKNTSAVLVVTLSTVTTWVDSFFCHVATNSL